MVPADSVLVKRVVTGVNASDVNFTSGKYQGSPAAANERMPFTAGFESVGVVCKAGTSSGVPFSYYYSFGSQLLIQRVFVYTDLEC